MIDKHLDFARLCHPERSAVRRAVEGSREGFTLVELLVYIAIVGIVVIVAGQAFSNSTKMRVRTQSMLKASEVAENVASLFKQDVAQTGAKNSMEGGGATGGDNFSAVNNNVYMDPDNTNDEKKDFSSFSVTTAGNFSDLKVRRMRYDDDGHFEAVEEVNWFVEKGILKRSCRTVDGTADADNCKKEKSAEAKKRAVEIATGVTRFVVKPALPGVSSGKVAQVFPPCNAAGECASAFRMIARQDGENFRDFTVTPSEGSPMVTLTGFVTNYDKNTNQENAEGKFVNQAYVTENVALTGSSTWKNSCYRFTLEPKTEYEIQFALSDNGATDVGRMFAPNRDMMSVGFRYATTGERLEGLEDFFFYPPADDKAMGTRSMRFNVSQKIEKVCLAFSFASYSPIANGGSLVISDLIVKKVESANYKFDYADGALTLQDKRNVKAMQLILNIERNGEGGNDTMVVRIPSNGVPD